MANSSTDKTSTKPHPLVVEQREKDIWYSLLVLRIVNALLLWTFFQPDEFYQAQEPAWWFAFGKGSHRWQDGAYNGPWITWEWKNQLRSSIYPVALGGLYKAFDLVCKMVLPPVSTAKFMLAPPKIIGALSAALMDFWSWKLGERLFGEGSPESTAVLYLTAASPWQWFVSARTFSNCLETTLTVMALYYWPWSWFTDRAGSDARKKDNSNLTYALLLAGFATVLRPPNVIIWIVMILFTLPQASAPEVTLIAQRATVAGLFVLGATVGLDTIFYGTATFPPINFLNFNISEGIADFYGKMRPDYYFTEGLPLLLTTALPFGILGVFDALTGRSPAHLEKADTTQYHASVNRCLGFLALGVPLAMSFLNHKEVRFIYPLLPVLILLSAGPAVRFFQPSSGDRTVLASTFLATNMLIALYFGCFHGSGVMNAMGFIRSEHERLNPSMVSHGDTTGINTTQVGVLMPCHSVPWRSQMVYHDIEIWALTCEPPLNKTKQEKAEYLDEADIFYQDPTTWLKTEFALRRRFWPMFLVFFDPLKEDLRALVAPGSYEEAWTGFNSLVHDDSRRRGNVNVWRKTEDFGGPPRIAL